MLGVLCFVSVLGRSSRDCCCEEFSETQCLRERRELYAIRHERSNDALRGCSKFTCLLVVVVAFLVWRQVQQIRQV